MRDFFRHYLLGLYDRLDEHHVFLLGGGLAFSFLVCIVPLVLVLLSVLGNALAASALEYRIEIVIEMLFPATQYTASLKNFFLARVDEIIRYREVAGYGGVFGLLLAASGLFSSMRTILNKVFRVRRDVHIVIGKLRDFGMVLLVLLFVLTSTTLFPLVEFMKAMMHKMTWLPTLSLNSSLHSLSPVLFFIIIFLLFFILYNFIPNENLGVMPTGVSALMAAIFWEIARQIFGYYLAHAAALDRVYGAYLFLVAVVLWIYYSALMFILGAEIGQLYRERLAGSKHEVGLGIDAWDL